jgi:DNA-binding NtrC family response regulator
MIEQASGGTLVLDEIGDLRPSSQVKLLRLLQEGEYLPLGEDKPKFSDARIIAMTNHDLQAQQNQGQFRKDLFYRLQTHHIRIPPLRERMSDLPLLVDHFLHKASQKLRIKTPTAPKELFDVLGAYDFPGNIRELEAMISDAVSVHPGGVLSTRSFRAYIGKSIPLPESAPVTKPIATDNPFSDWDKLPTLKDADRLVMEEAMRRSNNNLSVASHLLGISRQALGKRLQRQKK